MAEPFICTEIPAGRASWREGDTVHACEGNTMHPRDPGTFLVWTLCGRDVPAGQAQIIKDGFGGFIAAEAATCPRCQEASG